MIRRAGPLICIAVVAVAPFLNTGASLAQVGETEEVEATPSKEAWHNETPACVSFIDCSALPPANPYPEDTLHVSSSAGQETARTYLAFSPPLPFGAVLQEANLILPIDADPAHGSASPETASMIACLTDPTFKPVKGSVEKPPEVDCEVRKSALYSAPRGVFEVDLSRFVEIWDPDDRMALALLPAESATTNNETWHVVFPASEEETEEDPPPEEPDAPREITATFTYTIEETTSDPIGTEFDFDTTTGADPSSTGSFDSSTGPSFGDSADAGTLDAGTIDTGTTVADPAADPTEALGPEESQEVVAFAEGFAGPGFAYPIVWAVPLALLVGFAAAGRALTKELYRADD